jgi:hypothetical protein
VSRLTVTPFKLPKSHPFMQIKPDDPMQLHGSFDVQHEGRSFSVFLTRDNVAPGPRQVPDWRWHLSIAGRDMKVPEWNTIAAVAHQVRPGIPFALGVPPKSWWINVHSGALHLWELKDANLLDQWRHERLGQKPT